MQNAREWLLRLTYRPKKEVHYMGLLAFFKVADGDLSGFVFMAIVLPILYLVWFIKTLSSINQQLKRIADVAEHAYDRHARRPPPLPSSVAPPEVNGNR
jgi:hypothetical protein